MWEHWGTTWSLRRVQRLPCPSAWRVGFWSADWTPWPVIAACRARDTSSISRNMYLLTAVGFSLWFTYGILLGQWPLILTNGICLLLSGFILVMKVLPRHRKEAVAAALDPAG